MRIFIGSFHYVVFFLFISTSSFGQWSQIGGDINGEAEEDQSGYSISINYDGSIVAIGAYHNSGNGVWPGTGHVRVYQNLGSGWVQLGSDIDVTNQPEGVYLVRIIAKDGIVTRVLVKN